MTANLNCLVIPALSCDVDEARLVVWQTRCRATEGFLALMGARQRLADQGGVPYQHLPITLLSGDTDGPAR